MDTIDQSYIDGVFVPVTGNEEVDIVNPSTEAVIGRARLAGREDARQATSAAVRAQPAFASTTKAERIAILKRLQTALLAHADVIRDATIEEYGGPVARSQWVANYASQCFADAADALATYEFERRVGSAGLSSIVMEPVGVSGLFAPWTSTAGTMCSKLASAIAAGCATVIKPSELSPLAWARWSSEPWRSRSASTFRASRWSPSSSRARRGLRLWPACS